MKAYFNKPHLSVVQNPELLVPVVVRVGQTSLNVSQNDVIAAVSNSPKD